MGGAEFREGMDFLAITDAKGRGGRDGRDAREFTRYCVGSGPERVLRLARGLAGIIGLAEGLGNRAGGDRPAAALWPYGVAAAKRYG